MLNITMDCGGKMMKVYLDDERQTPEGWTRTHTVAETIELLETGEVTELSLDNDLGENQLEGFRVLDWLEEQVYLHQTIQIPITTIHSANPVRVAHMQQTIRSIERIRQQREAIDNQNKETDNGNKDV